MSRISAWEAGRLFLCKADTQSGFNDSQFSGLHLLLVNPVDLIALNRSVLLRCRARKCVLCFLLAGKENT